MKIARLAGLMLIAIFAVSLAAASVAIAEPEFKPATATFTGVDNAYLIMSADNEVDVVTCEKSTTAGNITSATTVGSMKVHFLTCRSTGPGGSNCTVKSVGATEGLIITTTLDGVLGLVLPKPSAGGVGLLLLPASGSTFFTLASNACTTETTKYTGNFAGEVEPLNKSQTSSTLKFTASGSKAGIKGFNPDGGKFLTAKLTAYTAEVSVSATMGLTYSASTEIT